MLARLMRKIYCDQKGITGLETAIILIAFVVVAAVFAYTVLSAGLFSSQKGQEAVYAGLEETRSTMELRSGVTAYSAARASLYQSDGATNINAATTRAITRVQFILTNTLDGEPIDLHPSYTGSASAGIVPSLPDEHTTIITLHDANVHLSDCAWTVDFIGNDTGDYLLEKNEKAVITVYAFNNDLGTWELGASGSTTFYSDDEDLAATELLDTDHEFTIEVKPATGAVLPIQRTTPAYLDTVMDLQ